MATFLTTSQAASKLGTSGPTIRLLIEKGELVAERRPRGSRFSWFIDSDSLDAFLSVHGRYDLRGSNGRVTLKLLNEKVETIEEQIRQMSRPMGEIPQDSASVHVRHLEDARARIFDLEEALARSHIAEELQREADEVRAEVVGHLLAAMTSAERADGLRREVITSLNEAVQSFSRPGHASSIRDS